PGPACSDTRPIAGAPAGRANNQPDEVTSAGLHPSTRRRAAHARWHSLAREPIPTTGTRAVSCAGGAHALQRGRFGGNPGRVAGVLRLTWVRRLDSGRAWALQVRRQIRAVPRRRLGREPRR